MMGSKIAVAVPVATALKKDSTTPNPATTIPREEVAKLVVPTAVARTKDVTMVMGRQAARVTQTDLISIIGMSARGDTTGMVIGEITDAETIERDLEAVATGETTLKAIGWMDVVTETEAEEEAGMHNLAPTQSTRAGPAPRTTIITAVATGAMSDAADIELDVVLTMAAQDAPLRAKMNRRLLSEKLSAETTPSTNAEGTTFN